MASEPKAGTSWLKSQAKRVGEGGEITISEADAVAAQVERWLRGHDVEYAPPTMIPMNMIDIRKSRGNQARKDPLVADSVDRFALGVKQGAKFPPIVVYPLAGKLVIIDGNNRHAAHERAGAECIYGIVISEATPGELIQFLTVEANAHHGVTPDMQWRLRQAFHLVSMGFSDQMAADACSVTPNQISAARRVQEADAKARTLKILGFSDLPSTTRGILASLKDDAVFSRASRLAISSAMTIDDIRDMIRGIKQHSSEAARLAAIEQVATERGLVASTRRALGGSGAKGGTSANRSNSSKALLFSGSAIVMRADEQKLAQSIVTKNDRDVIMHRLKLLEEKILACYVALDTRNFEDA